MQNNETPTVKVCDIRVIQHPGYSHIQIIIHFLGNFCNKSILSKCSFIQCYVLYNTIIKYHIY